MYIFVVKRTIPDFVFELFLAFLQPKMASCLNDV